MFVLVAQSVSDFAEIINYGNPIVKYSKAREREAETGTYRREERSKETRQEEGKTKIDKAKLKQTSKEERKAELDFLVTMVTRFEVLLELKSCPDGKSVSFKQDGQRFAKTTTVKLCVDQSYTLNLLFRPAHKLL